MTVDPQNDSLKQDESKDGLQRRWLLELNAARDALREFHQEGDVVDREFRGDGGGERLNLFFADVQTKSAILSGVPKVRARRRFADALDPVARVSAMALDRLLNSDIERESDGYRKALSHAKSDWLRSGMGQVRLRYVVETQPTPAVVDPMTGQELAPAGERKTFEDVETDYVKWRKFLWTPAEVWDDVRAVFYGLDLSREEWDRQFPGLEFKPKAREKGDGSPETNQVFGRAEVWEIWDRDSKRVLFLSEQHQEILKVRADPLGLPGFFPSPQPLMANATTSKCVPRSSYFFARALYEEAHELQRRIRALVKQVKVRGGYDAANEALRDILSSAEDGKLWPMKNYATMAGGANGLANSIALIPNKDQIEAILALSNRLALVKRDIYEITGQSDIMRGQAAEKATATEQRIKARFGSTRIQAEQDELARFASEAQRIRAFIISKFFDAETIQRRANLVSGDDAKLVPQAMALLKEDISAYRIDVDADSLAMTDYDAIQQENMSLLEGTAKFFGAVGPLATSPEMAEFFASLYQQAIAGARGAERFEGTIDRFLAQMRAQAQAPKGPPPPDPKLELEKTRAQAGHVKAQADMAKTAMDFQVSQAEHGMRMAELAAQQQARMAGQMVGALDLEGV